MRFIALGLAASAIIPTTLANPLPLVYPGGACTQSSECFNTNGMIGCYNGICDNPPGTQNAYCQTNAQCNTGLYCYHGVTGEDKTGLCYPDGTGYTLPTPRECASGGDLGSYCDLLGIFGCCPGLVCKTNPNNFLVTYCANP